MKFTAIDFETANSNRSSACSVGFAVVDNGTITDRFHQLIRPEPLYFDPFNIAIHGIRLSHVVNAPTFADYWPTLLSRIRGPLVAHNAAFDMSVIRASLDRSGIEYPAVDYFCTKVIAKLAWPELISCKLDHIAHTLGHQFEHHNALEDAVACAFVAVCACRRVRATTLHDLNDRCGLRIGRLYPGGYDTCGPPAARGRGPSSQSQLRR